MSDAALTAGPAGIHPDVLKLLGGSVVVAPAARSGRAAVRGVTLRYRAVEKLSEFLGTSVSELMGVIEVNERTAQRRREQGSLTADESDRLARIARVTRRAVEALGDADRGREWLRRPNRALRGHAPLALLGTDAGAERVTDELGRIEFGDLF